MQGFVVDGAQTSSIVARPEAFMKAWHYRDIEATAGCECYFYFGIIYLGALRVDVAMRLRESDGIQRTGGKRGYIAMKEVEKMEQ